MGNAINIIKRNRQVCFDKRQWKISK